MNIIYLIELVHVHLVCKGVYKLILVKFRNNFSYFACVKRTKKAWSK